MQDEFPLWALLLISRHILYHVCIVLFFKLILLPIKCFATNSTNLCWAKSWYSSANGIRSKWVRMSFLDSFVSASYKASLMWSSSWDSGASRIRSRIVDAEWVSFMGFIINFKTCFVSWLHSIFFKLISLPILCFATKSTNLCWTSSWYNSASGIRSRKGCRMSFLDSFVPAAYKASLRWSSSWDNSASRIRSRMVDAGWVFLLISRHVLYHDCIVYFLTWFHYPFYVLQ